MSIQSVGGESPRIQSMPVPQPTSERPVQTDAKPPGSSPFQRVLDGLGQEVNRGERLMHRALGAGSSGQQIAPTELLALQAGVYRYGEVVDLVSKLIDRTSTGLKTVVGGQ